MQTLRIPVNAGAKAYQGRVAPTHADVQALSDLNATLVLTKSIDGAGYVVTHRASGKCVNRVDTIRVGKAVLAALLADRTLDWSQGEHVVSTRRYGDAVRSARLEANIADHKMLEARRIARLGE